MIFSATSSLKKIAGLKKRIRIVQGGTSASKTISILMYLIHLAQTDKEATLTSITSESVPHLKRGALRDFKNIMQGHGYWKESSWNATDSIYRFETGSQIEFFSLDNPDKLRGGRRDRCFMNEANNNPFDAFEQLEVRTKEFFFIDYNPSSEFWAHSELKEKRSDVDFIILTYKDNEALSPEIISSIEMRKNNKAWWTVYGEGQLGEIETRIYTSWTILDSVPEGCRLERRGLDFGYTNDPSALVAVYRYNGGYVLDEELYRKGMSNKDLADYINNLPDKGRLVIADSAEPKSIDELKLYGVSVLPAQKGKDSVRQGIQLIQGLPMFITKRSVNLIKEYRNYLWLTDRDGKVLNEPTPGQDHGLDAMRYGISSLYPHTSELSDSALAIY